MYKNYLLPLYAAFFSLLFFSQACDPKNDPPPVTPGPQDFSCIKIFDVNGLGLGLHGDCSSSNDWEALSLNATENALLDFADTVSLAGTIPCAIPAAGIAPNPVTRGEVLHFFLRGETPAQNVKLKLVVVDEMLNVVQQWALQTGSTGSVALQMNPDLFNSGQYYRLYYRASAQNAPSILQGYGNFLVCKTYINGANTTIEADCM
jgi:hypothetical protein